MDFMKIGQYWKLGNGQNINKVHFDFVSTQRTVNKPTDEIALELQKIFQWSANFLKYRRFVIKCASDFF